MRRMYSEKQLTELVEKVVKNGSVEAYFKSVATNQLDVKGINIFDESGEHYVPIDFDYQDEDDHRIVIFDNVQVSGDLDVSGSINGEENPSVKPIYWHGLDLRSTSGELLQAVILSPKNDAYDKQSFKTWIQGISGAVRVICNGVIKVDSTYYPAYLLIKRSANSYRIYYTDSTTGYQYIDYPTFEDLPFTEIVDNFNQINA